MDKMFHGKLNDALADTKMDYTKLSTFVMLFHSIVPKSCSDILTSKKLFCLRKGNLYKLFERGLR